MASKRLSLGSHFLSSKKKEDLSDLFASFDKDHDGKISHSELEDMLHSAGINSSAIPSMVSRKKFSVRSSPFSNCSFFHSLKMHMQVKKKMEV